MKVIITSDGYIALIIENAEKNRKDLIKFLSIADNIDKKSRHSIEQWIVSGRMGEILVKDEK